MQGIDAVFFDKKFNVQRYMLRFIVGASSDEIRHEQLQRITKFREIADAEIAGVIDENYANFNTSLARFTVISNQLQDTKDKVREVSKRASDGKNILSSKTKNLRELLLQKYEAKKVVDIINDIQYIEAAPSKIHTMMSERNFTGAVDMFTRSLDLVFSEKLLAFNAITGVRNTLMECKQAIEDHLVMEIQQIIYMKGAFANFSKANQYSLAAIEHELSSESVLDNEFDKIMYQTDQWDDKKGKTLFADTTSAALGAAAQTNALESAVEAVKKIRREMEVIGSLKSTLENELNEVVIEISLICRGIFNSSSYTSFDNSYTEKKFGKHDHSGNFQTFLRLLFHVLRRIAQRHYLVASYFNSKGDSYNYGMADVLSKISRLLERVLGEYFEDASAVEGGTSVRDTAATVVTGDLFKLSRNKQPDDTSGSRLLLPHGSNSRVIEGETRTRVCEPSVFHLPVVYDDLQQVAKDLQELFAKSNPAPQANPSGFMAFLNQFIATKWIPKVKTRAQHFLNLKYRSPSNSWRLPVPSDTSYQPPSIDSLLFISEELSEMIQKMPDHMSELIGVLDTTVLKWLDDCAAIVKDIREPTLNHRQIVQSVAFSELLAVFQKYELYQRAKRDGPIPFQQARATLVSKTPISNAPRELIREKEYEMEKEYYDPDAWPGANGTKGLLMDNSRVAMLGYINSACDYIAQFLHTVGSRVNRRATSFGLSGSSSNGSTGASSGVGEALQATSWKCSSLADECLFFLRREIRLHCFYYLTQLVSQRFDLNEEQVTMAQDSVLCLNINLSSMEHALQPYLSSDKMALVFDGIDALLASILITDLQHMQGATLTKGGVQQMLLNVGALHQGLTGILYSYPSISRSGVHFDHAKRYYQLLLLPETQLELFLLDNRRAYSSDAYKSLWRVETPHRVLSKGSLNKLDSLLR